jgi:hypothetical protein
LRPDLSTGDGSRKDGATSRLILHNAHIGNRARSPSR